MSYLNVVFQRPFEPGFVLLTDVGQVDFATADDEADQTPVVRSHSGHGCVQTFGEVYRFIRSNLHCIETVLNI